MGEKEAAAVKRVVLETEVLVSALLLGGDLSALVTLWKAKKIVPVVSEDTLAEFTGALACPEFKFTEAEIEAIVKEQVLPYFEVVEVLMEVHGVCKDPGRDKFISCALTAAADVVVNKDCDLCTVGKYNVVKVMTAAEFLREY